MEDAARSQFNCIELSEGGAIDLIHGKRLKAGDKLAEPVAAFAPGGRLLAMLTRSGSQYKSLVVFPEVSK
jgi:tRNA pseudouridine55 synthase